MSRSVAIYVRVSTVEQDTSLQIKELKEAAASRGWSIVRIYEDKATGTNTKRASFQELMRDVRGHKFEIVLVWKLDRFARSMKDLIFTLSELTENRVDFVSLKDPGIDMTTPSGKLLLNMLGAFAEFEASIIKMRVKAGVQAKIARTGRWGRGKARDDRAIQALRSQGRSYREIATELGTSVGSVQRALGAVSKTPIKRFG